MGWFVFVNEINQQIKDYLDVNLRVCVKLSQLHMTKFNADEWLAFTISVYFL